MKRWLTIGVIALLGLQCVSFAQEEVEPSPQVRRVKAASAFMEEKVFAVLFDAYRFAKALFGVELGSTLAEEMLRGWQVDTWPSAERYLMHVNGKVLAHAGPEGSNALLLSEQVSALTLQADAELTLHILTPGNGLPAVCCIVCPLYNRDGSAKGSTVVTIPMSELWASVVDVLQVAPDETFYALDTEGRELYRHGADANGQGAGHYTDGAERKGLLAHMLREGAGESTYAFINEEQGVPSLRQVAWARCELVNRECILLVERASEMMAEEPPGVAGRWTGAYTLKGGAPAGSEGPARQGGGFNVLITQEGERCTLSAVGEASRPAAEGIFVNNTISAAQVAVTDDGPRKVWYWTGQYDPEKESIRGEVYGNAADAVVVRSFFLKRSIGEVERVTRVE